MKVKNYYEDKYILSAWSRDKKEVIAYLNNSKYVRGVLVAVTTYTITLLVDRDNKIILNKSNITIICKSKSFGGLIKNE